MRISDWSSDVCSSDLAAAKEPALAGLMTSYNVASPELSVDVDRTKAAAQGVAMTDVFETMQVYLGSLYVNDFNRFGRTYQVYAQAEADARAQPDAVGRLQLDRKSTRLNSRH